MACCCRSLVQGWAVACVVCGLATVGGGVTLTLVTFFAGPVFVGLQVATWFGAFVLAATAATAMLGRCGACVTGNRLRATAVLFLLVYLGAAVAAGCTLDLAADANCDGKMDCGFAGPVGGAGCGAHAQFVACFGPDTKGKTGGDLFYSKWADDCADDGGADDTCRGFRSRKECRQYKNPAESGVECEENGRTVEEIVLWVFIGHVLAGLLTAVPALGLALVALGPEPALTSHYDPPVSSDAKV